MMENRTIESYFVEDYERMKAENESLKERVRELEDTNWDFGITDLHQKFQAVRGSTCTKWVIKDQMLRNGRMTPERMRETIALDDETLFDKYRNRSMDYYSIIGYEEHEFQYVLHVKESRDEWTAVTDGKANSNLLKIAPRELGEDLCEDVWYPTGEADAVKEFLARNLRETMEEALEEYEQERTEKEEDDGSAS